MINIAICDDDQHICESLEEQLQCLAQELNISVEIDVFYNGEVLVNHLLRGKHYELLFLDIELEGITGIEIGRRIREELENEIIQMIYISSKQIYAMELFKIRPFEFLLKPLDEKSIAQVFQNVIKLIKKGKYYFECKVGKTYYKIPLEEIIYFESYDKKVNLVLKDKQISFYGKLKDVVEGLEHADFLAIHKSYLINYTHIRQLEYEKVIMSNHDVLPISQSQRSMIRKQHLRIHRENRR